MVFNIVLLFYVIGFIFVKFFWGWIIFVFFCNFFDVINFILDLLGFFLEINFFGMLICVLSKIFLGIRVFFNLFFEKDKWLGWLFFFKLNIGCIEFGIFMFLLMKRCFNCNCFGLVWVVIFIFFFG